MKPVSVLVVAAHPDDEVLGCGGTMSLLSRRGNSVRACFLSSLADARSSHPGKEALIGAAMRAQAVLGCGDPIFGEFENIQFNVVPHLSLVQFIENAIRTVRAEVVFTHHPSDLNDDHRCTSAACDAAVRLYQRGVDTPPITGYHYMEVLSSTDWALGASQNRFVPTSFFQIGDEGVSRKLQALREYKGVMRKYPHPRSEEAIRAQASLRGAMFGVYHAEAFQTAFLRLDS